MGHASAGTTFSHYVRTVPNLSPVEKNPAEEAKSRRVFFLVVLSAKSRRELKEPAEMMEFSLSTHLFVFQELDESIVSLFPKFGFFSAELWAMPPPFPYGDAGAAGRTPSPLARPGIRAARLHAPLSPHLRSS